MTLRQSAFVYRGAIVVASAVLLTSLLRAQSIPTDPKQSCIVTPTTFASWFASGTPALNGVVNPANSVTFPHNNNCDFYQWSEQMFLWLTSPSPAQYGGNGRIFDSPVFFDVSAADPKNGGARYFVPHVPGQLRIFDVRTSQTGPHGLPVVFDKSGRMLEIERPQLAPSGRPLIRTAAGNLAEVGRVTVANRKAAFVDPSGKAIQPQAAPRAAAASKGLPSQIVQQFIVGGVPIIVDFAGNVLDVEEGQAGGGGALVAQNGSLIYYTTIVNDVYAYFLSGTKTGGIMPPPTQFPTTQADLNQIVAYAQKAGVTFPDPNALAIEVKASWIETTNLPNPGNYITMSARIPTYDTSDPTHWVPGTPRQAQLAMIGMHVVGSVAGHPEMVWSTFEHVSNAPSATYQYINSNNQPITVNQSTAGSWLLTATGASAPFNAQIAIACGSDVYGIVPPATPPKVCPPPPPPAFVPIKAANVLRQKPFGAGNTSPNKEDGSAAASNTELISIDNTVNIPGGDVRNNYFLMGATWTNGGVAPNGSYSNNPTFNEIGTSLLANSTMETFQQGTDNTSNSGVNCFFCHTSNQVGVSHVYNALQPLTPVPNKK